MTKLQTLEDIFMTMLVNAGLEKDESTEMLVGEFMKIFEFRGSLIELQCRISEIELALSQKNKQISSISGDIVDDMQQRNLIDPQVLKLRLQGLIKKEAQMRRGN